MTVVWLIATLSLIAGYAVQTNKKSVIHEQSALSPESSCCNELNVMWSAEHALFVEVIGNL